MDYILFLMHISMKYSDPNIPDEAMKAAESSPAVTE